MDAPRIRTAGEADTDDLAAMLTGLTDFSLYMRFQTAVGRPPRESLLLRLLRPAGAAWVATRDDEIVGHAMWAWAAASTVPTAELAVVISEPEQNRGLGIQLLGIAAGHAFEAGATRLLFVVNAANDRVARMIRRRWPAVAVERDGSLLNFVVPAAAQLPPASDSQMDQACSRSKAAASSAKPFTGASIPTGSSSSKAIRKTQAAR
ncbi:GNAT family N-acetyltransferase [Kribbella qitaiheensis]|uniref:GNAT family N-acetyltransferase n=2 Tax=Kribbella qitaiheensis TaxID=1544730 RepID=A0A7G6XAB7_9ACTN|nr:GNAT family N-acetyltransferase [Kribbella qitaiheensis]